MSETELQEVRAAVWHSCVDRAVSVVRHHEGPWTADAIIKTLYREMRLPKPAEDTQER